MADEVTGRWTLTSGADLVGVIDVRDSDFPWLEGSWTPTREFDPVAPLFRHELQLMDKIDEGVGEWEAAYASIREAMTLHYPDGRKVPEFLLHIDGSKAWFRWSDAPDT